MVAPHARQRELYAIVEERAVGELSEAVVKRRMLQARDDLFMLDGGGDLRGHELQQLLVALRVMRIDRVALQDECADRSFLGFERDAEPASRVDTRRLSRPHGAAFG